MLLVAETVIIALESIGYRKREDFLKKIQKKIEKTSFYYNTKLITKLLLYMKKEKLKEKLLLKQLNRWKVKVYYGPNSEQLCN